MGVGLLPYFGAAWTGGAGLYSASGRLGRPLLRFNNGKTAFGVYSSRFTAATTTKANALYPDGEEITLPVFGMHYEAAADIKESGFLAVAVSGAAQAALNAVPGGVNCSYNNVWFSFTYRASRTTDILSRDLGGKSFNMIARHRPPTWIRWWNAFLTSESTGYTDMAHLLREELLSLGMEPLEAGGPEAGAGRIQHRREAGIHSGRPHENRRRSPALRKLPRFCGTLRIRRPYCGCWAGIQTGPWAAASGTDTVPPPPPVEKRGWRLCSPLLQKQGRGAVSEAEPARFTDGTLRFNGVFHAASRLPTTDSSIQLPPEYQRAGYHLPVSFLLAPHLLPDVLDQLEAALPDSVNGLSLGSVGRYPYADYGRSTQP